MLVEIRDPVPPLHHRTVAIIVIGPDRTARAATRIRDKVALLQACTEEDMALVANAQPWVVEVFTISPRRALKRLQDSIPKDPTRYYLAFGEQL